MPPRPLEPTLPRTSSTSTPAEAFDRAALGGATAPRRPERFFRGYALDCDGTVYLGDELLPGAREAILQLKRHARVVYLTNKPLEPPAAYAAKLTRLGIETREADVVSSTDALVLYLARRAPRARLLVIGEPPLIELLAGAGHEVTAKPDRVEVVVVAFDRSFDYGKLHAAFLAVRAGARIVATNPDPYCPTPDGGLPDCGAMLAAVEAATGATAEAVVGKPSRYMADAVLERLAVPAEESLVVGDRLTTDVRLAREAGMASALVLTGVTSLDDLRRSEEPPDYVLAALTELLPAGGRA